MSNLARLKTAPTGDKVSNRTYGAGAVRGWGHISVVCARPIANGMRPHPHASTLVGALCKRAESTARFHSGRRGFKPRLRGWGRMGMLGIICSLRSPDRKRDAAASARIQFGRRGFKPRLRGWGRITAPTWMLGIICSLRSPDRKRDAVSAPMSLFYFSPHFTISTARIRCRRTRTHNTANPTNISNGQNQCTA